MKTFIIDKENLNSIDLIGSNIDELKYGEILMEIKSGAFTSNNITYAVLGKRFKYWSFFPHQNGGVIPVWGFAVVVESKREEINVGDEYYGYYPMSTHLIINPDRINNYGMIDGMDHRSDLPGVYNYYEHIGSEFFASSYLKKAYMIFQPLFATSFLLEYYYRENDCFGSKDIFISSASSKTAIAFAFMLQKNSEKISVIGVTSKSNVNFCSNLGCYKKVFDYSQISELKSESSAIVDFAGNHDVLDRLQRILFKSLKKCTTVGLSHWDKGQSDSILLFKNELFFAPVHAKKRQEEWGGKVFKLRLNEALFPFMRWSLNSMSLEEKKMGEVKQKYTDVLNGKISPEVGIIFNFQD